jgi:hypothetical protein
MEKYLSIYKGTIIQNNDPIQGGRVKVFVPIVHATLLPLTKDQYQENVNFGVFGTNVNKQNTGQVDLTQYLKILKQKLPWCPVIMPITGETGNMKYNSSTKTGTPSDSPSRLASLGSETGEIGGGPDDYLKDYTSRWGSSGEIGGSMSNPGTGNFNINKNANMAKGNFAIPSVNSLVWVTFINGDPQFPIVMGAAPAVLDFQQNISPSGYPGTYENS